MVILLENVLSILLISDFLFVNIYIYRDYISMKNNFHSLGWTSKVKFFIQDVWLMLGIDI